MEDLALPVFVEELFQKSIFYKDFFHQPKEESFHIVDAILLISPEIT
jgi:hypothetical protein